MLRTFFIVIFSAIYCGSFSQHPSLQGIINGNNKVLYIDPAKTDTRIHKIQSDHLVMYPVSGSIKRNLIIFIVGTGGKATDSKIFDSLYVSWGYPVIALDYDNRIVTTVCSDSEDSACFDHFRQEIVFGTSVSSQVEVDSANSIMNRLQKLLLYLQQNDPAGRWNEYLDHGNISWQHIIAAGHSQGAGHVAFIAKHFRLHRVMIFAGPQDYLSKFHRPAGWVYGTSATPEKRYYAFLHIKDPYGEAKQLAGCRQLLHSESARVTNVKPGETIHSHHHILITDIDSDNPHGSVLMPAFENVRKFMLGEK